MTDPGLEPEPEPRRAVLDSLDEVQRWAIGVLGRYQEPDERLVDMVKLAAAKYKPMPPKVGDVITNGRLDDCTVGTVLRGIHAAMAAVRSVNGWTVTGMTSGQAETIIKINRWAVVYVPLKDNTRPLP